MINRAKARHIGLELADGRANGLLHHIQTAGAVSGRPRRFAVPRGPAASRRGVLAPTALVPARRPRAAGGAARSRPTERSRLRSRRSWRTPPTGARPGRQTAARRQDGPQRQAHPSDCPRNTSGTIRPSSASNPSRPSPCSLNRALLSSSERRCVPPVRSAASATEPSSAIRRPTRSAGTCPAAATTSRPASTCSSMTSARAEIRARPRLATSSKIAARSVWPPIAREISTIAPSASTVCSSSSQRASEPL